MLDVEQIKKARIALALVVVILIAIGIADVILTHSEMEQKTLPVSETPTEYDPWNISITIKKHTPIYTEAELEKIFEPVTKDEL